MGCLVLLIAGGAALSAWHEYSKRESLIKEAPIKDGKFEKDLGTVKHEDIPFTLIDATDYADKYCKDVYNGAKGSSVVTTFDPTADGLLRATTRFGCIR